MASNNRFPGGWRKPQTQINQVSGAAVGLESRHTSNPIDRTSGSAQVLVRDRLQVRVASSIFLSTVCTWDRISLASDIVNDLTLFVSGQASLNDKFPVNADTQRHAALLVGNTASVSAVELDDDLEISGDERRLELSTQPSGCLLSPFSGRLRTHRGEGVERFDSFLK